MNFLLGMLALRQIMSFGLGCGIGPFLVGSSYVQTILQYLLIIGVRVEVIHIAWNLLHVVLFMG